MQTVRCPHCSAELAYDASRSGQVTSCGVCGQLFQMPALVPTEEEPAYRDDLALDGPPPGGTAPPKRHDRRGNRGFVAFAVFALAILPLITLTVLIVLIVSHYAGKQRPDRHPAVSTPRRK